MEHVELAEDCIKTCQGPHWINLQMCKKICKNGANGRNVTRSSQDCESRSFPCCYPSPEFMHGMSSFHSTQQNPDERTTIQLPQLVFHLPVHPEQRTSEVLLHAFVSFLAVRGRVFWIARHRSPKTHARWSHQKWIENGTKISRFTCQSWRTKVPRS